jgi:hypothetical protein
MEAPVPITFEYVLTLVEQLSMGEQVRLLEWIIQQIKQSFGVSESTIPKQEEMKAERARVRQLLREAGLLTELGPRLTKLANKSTTTLADVVAELDSLSDKSLSDLVLEQRRAKLW